jgi:probable F420-dependent oxidoreductase
MRIGIGLPQSGRFDHARDIAGIARTAETAGYDSVWVYERLLFPLAPRDGLYQQPGVPWPANYQECADPVVTLSIAAAVTSRVRLGTAVLVAPLHTPIQLARQLATLDKISGGRVVAGFGSGWSTDEYAAAGADFADRGRRLDETIDVCRAVWGPDPVGYARRYASIAPAYVRPKPATSIPIYLGGMSTRAIERVAQRGDGWLPAQLPPARLSLLWRRIRARAEAVGRDPDKLALCVRANIRLRDTPTDDAHRLTYTGTIDQVVGDLLATHAAGAHEVLIELQNTVRDAAELADLAARLRETLDTAGVLD